MDLLDELRERSRRIGETVRRRTGSVLVDGFFRSMAMAGRLHPNARPEKHNAEVLRDIPYAPDGDRDHLLDIYRPTASERPWPVVLYVHGGGFRILSKDSHWVMGLAFARRRLIVFNINYRLAPRHHFPAALEDTCRAFRWVLDNAARFGGDPTRILLAGESAGANLITSLTLCCCYRRPEPFAREVWDTAVVPRVVLPACGIYQVSDTRRFGRRRYLPVWVMDRLDEVHRSYLGEHAHEPALLELANPLLVLEQGRPPDRPLPPFFVPVGTKDPLLDDTRRLKAALDRMDVPCEARYYEGEIHAFHALAYRPQARRCWRDTYTFLDRYLFASKTP
jgi:acetyl esterase